MQNQVIMSIPTNWKYKIKYRKSGLHPFTGYYFFRDLGLAKGFAIGLIKRDGITAVWLFEKYGKRPFLSIQEG
jgi:hypothetical protein